MNDVIAWAVNNLPNNIVFDLFCIFVLLYQIGYEIGKHL